MSEQIARAGKEVASDHLRSSSYGASANLARSRPARIATRSVAGGAEGRKENSPGLQAWEDLRKAARPERGGRLPGVIPKR